VILSLLATLALLAGLAPVGTALAAGDGTSRTIAAAGTTQIAGTSDPGAVAEPGGAPRQRETRGPRGVGHGSGNAGHGGGGGVFPSGPLPTPWVWSSTVAGSNPQVEFGFPGLNHFDQRFGANNGNQFSLEPPDQALCVGNGYTVESTNSVLRVYSSADGSPLTPVQDLNTFFGYAAQFNRTTGFVGDDVIDPVCLYDPENHRFVVAITTLHTDPSGSGAYTGKNTIDIAVSNTGDPTGAWTIYYTPAQNDGTDGTPDHQCDGGYCFQDYPHIGADANGVYITTNEYALFGDGYNGVEVFAFSKKQLKNHPATITVTTLHSLSVKGTPGFTVWPAISPAGQYENAANGTEYFLSSLAGDGYETGNTTGTANKIAIWALTNTRSLNYGTPDLRLSVDLIKSATYVFPPKSDQKPGDIPLGDCLNDTSDAFGNDVVTGEPLGCWWLFLDPPVTWQPEVMASLDSNDTRMQQTWFTNGRLWGALDTAVKVGGEVKAGILWFSIDPKISWFGKVSGKIDEQGYLALRNNNLSYPAIAMGTNGRGVIAFTVVGEDYYPSAGYAMISSSGHVGKIHISGMGLGPDDGFTSYTAFVGDPPRTRWGDYGAAVTDGHDLWIASEWIGQTCNIDEFFWDATADLTCGGTRTAFANWGTYITKLDP
jgi:hypothetical protein